MNIIKTKTPKIHKSERDTEIQEKEKEGKKTHEIKQQESFIKTNQPHESLQQETIHQNQPHPPGL